MKDCEHREETGVADGYLCPVCLSANLAALVSALTALSQQFKHVEQIHRDLAVSTRGASMFTAAVIADIYAAHANKLDAVLASASPSEPVEQD